GATCPSGLLFFFFQAEDGIRDGHVTGVQTCALPISRLLPQHSHGSTFGGGPLACRVALEFLAMLDEILPGIGEVSSHFRRLLERSEERRVGKECIARWWKDGER